MATQTNITTNTLISSLTRLIKNISQDPSISNNLAERMNSLYMSSLANFGEASIQNNPYTNTQIAELSNYLHTLQDFFKNGIGSFIAQGLDVESTEPVSSYVRITKGFGYIEGKRIDFDNDVLINIDLSISNSIYIYLNHSGAIGFDAAMPGSSMPLARVDKKSDWATSIYDNSSDTNLGAYIVSAKDILFDNRFRLDDDSIAATKNILEIIFAENIFGTLRLSENLKIQNTQGSLDMDSKQIRLFDPNKNLLAKFNTNGIFFYNSKGEEYSHFGKLSARIGNIKVTPYTLQSTNFTSSEAGFCIKADGNAEFNNVIVRGTVYADAGLLANWDIGQNILKGGNTELDSAGIIRVGINNDIAVLDSTHSTYRSWIGHENPSNAPFKVSKTGKLFSTAAEIANWEVDLEKFYKSNIEIRSDGVIKVGAGNSTAILSSVNQDYRFWIGAENPDNALFKVNYQGAITAKAGSVAAFNINNNILKSQNDSLILDSLLERILVGESINIDGANKWIESTNYQSGHQGWRIDGDGNAEFQNCTIRGRLHTTVFVKDQIHATNGQLLVTNASTLKYPINNIETKLYISEGVFVAGNRLKMKDGFKEELLKVVSYGSDANGDYINTTRNLDGAGSYSWDSATAIVSVESRVQLVASGATAMPYIDVVERTGDLSETLKVRMGNLEGISGASGYGLWAENVYLTGSINAVSGSIGGWTANATTLTGGSTTLNSAGIIKVGIDHNSAIMSSVDSTYRLWIGNTDPANAPFSVSKTGNLKAVNVDLQGFIKATSGYFGTPSDGWDITSNKIIAKGSGSIETDSAINLGIKLDANSLRGYDGTNLRFELQTNGAGFLGTQDTISWTNTGLVNISGFKADVSSLTSGVGANAVGMKSSGIYAFYAGDTDPSFADFSVKFNGELYSSQATITGDITCTNLTATQSGNLAGFTISANALTATPGSKIQTSPTATINGVVIDQEGIRGYGGWYKRFDLTSSDGRIWAREADIGQRIVKIDNLSNSGTRINDAITYLGWRGGIIYLEPGYHYIDTGIIIGISNITIQGAGAEATHLIPYPDPLISVIHISNDVNNIKIRDLDISIREGLAENADYCINTAGAVKVSNFSIENCTFDSALITNVDIADYEIFKVEQCQFVIVNGAIGLRGGFSDPQKVVLVENCQFKATPNSFGEGTGIENCLNIKSCQFYRLARAINIQGVSSEFIIDGNLIDDCNSGIYASTNSHKPSIINNKIKGFSSFAIQLMDIQNSYIISNNQIYNGSGTYAIYVEESYGGNITYNVISDCAFSSRAINVDGNISSWETKSVNIIGNTIKDSSFVIGIYCNMVAGGTFYEEGAVVVNNNLHNNTRAGSITGLEILDNGAVIQGNLINHLVSTGDYTNSVRGISSNCDFGSVTSNTVRSLDGNGQIFGIYNLSCNVINSNVIEFECDSVEDAHGIWDGDYPDANGLVVNGNRVRVRNVGAGTGYAFQIDHPNGCAVGNSYYGSDSLGTLSLGKVGFNDD